MLVGSIFSATIEEALKQMEELKGKVDLAEIRLDALHESSWSKLALLKEKSLLPLLFTFRQEKQGGHSRLTESKKLSLYEKALSLQPAFADIEADTDPSFIKKIKDLYPQITLIGSFHDFEKTPLDLIDLLQSMQNKNFSIYKIAVYANSTIDLMRLMIFARKMSPKIPLCCIAMGAYGQPSRILGPIVGNVLNYTSLQGGIGSLYQYSLDTLQDIYSFFRLTKNTKVYALLGDPIEASRGHIFHNEVFLRKGINAVYLKLRLAASELAEFFSLATDIPFGGFSVTMPLKEAIIPFLTQVDPSASAIGAVNTILVQGSDRIGFNTDGRGALHAIELYGVVREKKLAILGAGGSTRAIAYEAIQRGAEVMIFNRTLSRAEQLSKDLGCRAYALDSLSQHPYDCLINTIPPHSSGESPISVEDLLPDALIMDINSVSLSPPLVRIVRERGGRCLDGNAMFEEQARLQQAVWFKKMC